MDIPNLNTNQTLSSPANNRKNLLVISIVVVTALTSGFWISRFFPSQNQSTSSNLGSNNSTALSADTISHSDQLAVDQWYGDVNGLFKDTATGTISNEGINGEGTHTLIRPGGDDQNAALTSSVVDLDLFVDKKVEIKGETNVSQKVGWFLDVGSIKIVE